MKKTYKNPSIQVVDLSTETFIAESVPVGDNPTDPNEFEVKEHAGENGKSIWDEEW